MQLEDLEKLNKKFAKEAHEFNSEFSKLFAKWFKKSPRLAIVMAVHLPINMIMNMINRKLPVYECFPELPEMFIRFVAPFIKLREKWGKIPGDEFTKEYQKLYESQFNKFFADEKMKEQFKEWFDGSK